MSLRLRAMQALDIPAALRLWADTEGVEVAEGDRPAEIARYLKRNPRISSVAYDGRRLVAAVLCGHDGRRGFVYHLAVAANQRGRGIARRVMQRSLAALKAKGISRVLLLVAADNKPGRRFWRKQEWEDMPFARPMGIDL